jgi:hypothetical protein
VPQITKPPSELPTRRHLQEEGGYEDAAYHKGAENGGEAHVEAATLEQKGASFRPSIQTLEGGGQRSSKSGGVVRLCEDASNGARTAPELCARYASIFSEAWHFVKHAAKGAWHRFVNVVHYIINARNSKGRLTASTSTAVTRPQVAAK